MNPTQEQVIAWAREAGGWKQWEARVMTPQVLEHFAALAYEAGRKDENEACVKVCDELADSLAGEQDFYGLTATEEIADAIRARVKT